MLFLLVKRLASPDHAVQDGVDENAHVEEEVVLAGNVQLRVAETVLVADVLVEHAHRENGKRREEEVVAGDQNRIVDGLRGVAAEEGVPEVRQREGEVLVEEVPEICPCEGNDRTCSFRTYLTPI